MKTITLSHYTMKDIDPTPWRQTWDNLVHFASRMAPKLAPLGFQLKLRKVELEELTQDNLMSANMVTIACPDNDTPETPIENLLMLELDFTQCSECQTPEGQEFPCRTFTSFGGEVCQALPEEFFMEAALRVASSRSMNARAIAATAGAGAAADARTANTKEGMRMAKLVITTKGGDKGTTSLANGERVAKDDRRVELYGTVDECQAALGMARAFCEDGKTAEDIYFIEDYLFGAMAYFAKCDYDEPDPMILESMSDRVKDALPDETMAFVRPGDTKCGAALHLARTIARRAERAATPLFRDGEISEQSYKFLNRLSDVIYLLSLKVDADSKK